MSMRHSKHNKQRNDDFLLDRKSKQSHLDIDLMSSGEIREALEGLTPAQITAITTLIFNLYEEKFHHIWFPKSVREEHIYDVHSLIKGLRDCPFIMPLDEVFTGMGVDDRSTAFK